MKIELTDDELLLLDGRVNETAQKEVEAAKLRLSAAVEYPERTKAEAAFIADTVTRAKKDGRLIYEFKSIKHCDLCGKSGGYLPYKSGPRRGKPNYDKPTYLGGVELGDNFIRMTGYASQGCCRECMDKLVGDLKTALIEVKAELPRQLRTEGQPVYKRWKRHTCSQCGWKGHEGEMKLLRTLFADGWYHGECPSCGAKNLPFGNTLVEFDKPITYEIVEEAACTSS